MSIPVCTIDATGCHVPTYADILAALQAAYQAIYGADVYLGNDSQDGQFLALLALGFADTNNAILAAYNSFSPATAQGAGLSSVIKINGLKRELSSASSADLLIGGTVGTTITNGVVTDANNYRWDLPASVTIPASGAITVTALCEAQGAILAPAGTIATIATPTRGWTGATNPADAVAGAPVETDAALRVRQTISTSLPSQTIRSGVVGAIASVAGVGRIATYENDTANTDANGLPSTSFSAVVEGGDALQVATQIAYRKTLGGPTYGTTSETVTDSSGSSVVVNFFRPATVNMGLAITIKAKAAYNSTIGIEIQDALIAWVNALPIGQAVSWGALFSPASLPGNPDGATYNIESLAIGPAGGTLAMADFALAFNQVGLLSLVNLSFNVTS